MQSNVTKTNPKKSNGRGWGCPGADDMADGSNILFEIFDFDVVYCLNRSNIYM